jgi:hypothetical protein
MGDVSNRLIFLIGLAIIFAGLAVIGSIVIMVLVFAVFAPTPAA